MTLLIVFIIFWKCCNKEVNHDKGSNSKPSASINSRQRDNTRRQTEVHNSWSKLEPKCILTVRFTCMQGLREGSSGGTLYPGPVLGGHGFKRLGRVQVSALNFGITPQHRNQTCLQQKYQSAYSVLVIGRHFSYTAFRASNSGRFN